MPTTRQLMCLTLLAPFYVVVAATCLEGAVFIVQTAIDVPDLAAGDGECRINVNGPPMCSLRAAVQQANATAGQDEVILPTGSFVLTRPGSGEDLGATGDLDVSEALILRGAGIGLTVVHGMAGSADPDRVLDLVPGSAGPTVEIRDLTIRDGYAATGHAIRNDGATLLLQRVALIENGGELSGPGGALANLTGAATLDRVRIEDNLNVCPPAALCIGVAAAGIYNEGVLTVRESLVKGNMGYGAGGIGNESPGVVAVENSTFSGNVGSGGPGAIYNGFGLSLIHVTLAENDGSSAHDLVTAGGAVSSVRGSIVTSGSFGLKCSGSGTVLSGGFNLENGASCGFAEPTDLVATSPDLLPLADNGGPTLTYRPHPESPALDAAGLCTGISGAPLERDQRGSRRPVNVNGGRSAYCDIGAYEWLPDDLFADGFESGDTTAWS